MTTLSAQTFDGVPGGMNLALPAHEIPDTEARYLQDILLDYPGLIRMRGPVTAKTGVMSFASKVCGIVQTLDPLGSSRVAVLRGDNANGFLSLLDPSLASAVDIPWNGALPASPPSNPYRVVDAKQALGGGVFVGTSSQYNANGPVQTLALWKGGYKANYTTGTITLARNSASVVGSGTAWVNNVVAGMFLFANTDDPFTNTYIGTVKSVDDNTHITLTANSPYVATAKAYTLQAVRGFAPKVTKGRLTTNTANTTVTGANTKFTTQGLTSGTWNLYRGSDMNWIGKVLTVNNDISITLAANAAIALNNEKYIAIRGDGDWNLSTQAVADRKVGFLNAGYANRQWYANNGQRFELTARVWFSDVNDPEAVDMSPADGDFIDIVSSSSSSVNSPVISICPAYNSLVAFKENETFGIFGSSPSNFNVKKIDDDGTLSGMSVQSYGGGVIWAGRTGIHFFDGIQADNITADKLGDYYKNMIRSFDPTTYRMWSMMSRDHYFLFIENASPSVGVTKGTSTSTPNKLTIVINMLTRAISLMTNLSLRGAIQLPAFTGQEVWYVVNNSTNGFICSVSDLFDSEGQRDTIACDGGTPGPDFYMESKKYAFGDPMRKKLLKQLAINYLAQGDSLKIDTVIGLNSIGATSGSVFPATVYVWDNLPAIFPTWDALAAVQPTWDSLVQSVFQPKRVKFLKRSQEFAFRIYQNSSSVNRVRLGPFQIGFKLQRLGRI
jgi:hypothetical protein